MVLFCTGVARAVPDSEVLHDMAGDRDNQSQHDLRRNDEPI
jgi:hypothetical protein